MMMAGQCYQRTWRGYVESKAPYRVMREVAVIEVPMLPPASQSPNSRVH